MIKINNFQEYEAAFAFAEQHPEEFWAQVAKDFIWVKPWDKVLNWDFENPTIEWFKGAQTNITVNCLDRHLPHRANQNAVVWEPNSPNDEAVVLTYSELHSRVSKVGNALRKMGVQKGDRVCIYMPMIPELLIAVLACARIGAVHSVVFAGFSASSLSDRIIDADAKVVLTSDGAMRGNKTIAIKEIVDEALLKCPSVTNVLCFKYLGMPIHWVEGRDADWAVEEAYASDNCMPEVMEATDMLFILYTSGSTGKPKCVVHGTAGYMVYSEFTFRNMFQYQEGEVFWCTADLGWITGHTYLTYGPLLAGATTVVFEGTPTWPGPDRFWQVIERHNVNILYTAPTAIRSLMSFGQEYPERFPMESLRVLGSVGEPINEEAWHWYHEHVGKSRCALIDSWWQTETGGAMITPLAGITPEKPSYAGLPMPGVQLILVDNEGNEIKGNNVEGNLCIKFPTPGMLQTTYGDHERCKQTYFSTYKNLYFTGDGARRDEDGYYRILGRVDDVINVSGHRMGTAEVENAINEHPVVIESAVVGYPHEVKGQGIYAFVITEHAIHDQDQARKEIIDVVSKLIGPIARPDKIQFVRGLPKTRSGKIMRRILRKIAEGDATSLGDITTLTDPTVVKDIIQGALVAVKTA
jgi:acetyl-CoA synthetase